MGLVCAPPQAAGSVAMVAIPETLIVFSPFVLLLPEGAMGVREAMAERLVRFSAAA